MNTPRWLGHRQYGATAVADSADRDLARGCFASLDVDALPEPPQAMVDAG
jgi:hypothetical protein